MFSCHTSRLWTRAHKTLSMKLNLSYFAFKMWMSVARLHTTVNKSVRTKLGISRAAVSRDIHSTLRQTLATKVITS